MSNIKGQANTRFNLKESESATISILIGNGADDHAAGPENVSDSKSFM